MVCSLPWAQNALKQNKTPQTNNYVELWVKSSVHAQLFFLFFLFFLALQRKSSIYGCCALKYSCALTSMHARRRLQFGLHFHRTVCNRQSSCRPQILLDSWLTELVRLLKSHRERDERQAGLHGRIMTAKEIQSGGDPRPLLL